MDRLFGTDGVRGVAGEDLTGQLAMDLAAVAAELLQEARAGAVRAGVAQSNGSRLVAVVGRDPRASGEFLEAAVVAGLAVKAGDPLLVLEAMKMEQTIRTTMDGVVEAILVKPGQVVAPGQMLVEIRSMEETGEHATRTAGGG